jgi:hypothetical protein
LISRAGFLANGPSRVTFNRDCMRALMIQVVCIQVACIQVVCIQVACATGLRTDGCGTLHPLCAAALIAWVARNGRCRERIEISNEQGTTAAALTLR